MEDKNLFLNYLGYIPFNADELPERKLLFGKGTDRPVGISPSQIFNLYWTAKVFSVSINVGTFQSPLDVFLNSLSNSSSGAGLIAGINQASGQQTGSQIIGKTSISHKHMIKNREQMKKSGKLNDLTWIKDVPPRQENLISNTFEVNEGVICGAGPVHTLKQGRGLVQIDFSNIIYARGQYWPQIIVQISESSQLSLSTAESFTSFITRENKSNGRVETKIGFVEISGMIDFAQIGSIPMYASQSSGGAFSFAAGSIIKEKNSEFLHQTKSNS
jgi:hypothetical protein